MYIYILFYGMNSAVIMNYSWLCTQILFWEAQRTIWDAEDQTLVGCVQSKCSLNYAMHKALQLYTNTSLWKITYKTKSHWKKSYLSYQHIFNIWLSRRKSDSHIYFWIHSVMSENLWKFLQYIYNRIKIEKADYVYSVKKTRYFMTIIRPYL